MDYQAKTLVIIYPNGSTQRVRPTTTFNGDWAGLAFSIAAQYFPEINGKRNVNYRIE